MQGLRLFAMATMLPVALIIIAVVWGGAWGWVAVGYLTVLVFLLDRLVAIETRNTDPDAEFPAANSLLVALSGLHFLLLILSLWAAAGPGSLSIGQRLLVLVATGMVFGQISHPVAHELIHRNARALRLLGRLVYTSMLVGHHASAHLRVHHVHVGSAADPNSARPGEGFYRYALRASRQSFFAGLAAENRLRADRAHGFLHHPYALYLGGAALLLVTFYVLFGPVGLAAFLSLALYAQMQILMSDYVQHYGLRRAVLPDGRLEPVGPQHSWNSPHWFSSAMMINAPRHSDHHVTPSRAYPALQLNAEHMPMLPYPLPFMAALALVPTQWRRVMDRRCGQWRSDTGEPLPAPTSGE